MIPKRLVYALLADRLHVMAVALLVIVRRHVDDETVVARVEADVSALLGRYVTAAAVKGREA